MTDINAKNSYFAKGDTLVSGGQGPDEPVVGSTQLMTAPRFAALQDAEAELRRFAATMIQHGGHDTAKKGRLFENVKVEVGSLPDTIAISPAIAGYDPTGTQITGWCPKRDASGLVLAQPASGFVIDTDTLVHFTDVPYANVGGSEYNVGIPISTVPSKAEQNSRTGKFELLQETAVVGVSMTPFGVAYDTVLNETTLTLENNAIVGNNSSLAGRSALAWFINDDGFVEGETATAILFGTLVWNGTRNELILGGAFGQDLSGVDVDAANYTVCVLGPMISVGTIDTDIDGVAWLAHGDNDTAWVTDGQNRYPSVHHTLQNFVRMSDPSASSPDLVSNPKISVRPNDNEPGSELQIAVYKDAAATVLAFGVDKDGNILGSVGSTPEFGVDTATVGVETGFSIFHTHTPGVGVANKGVRFELLLETNTEGVKEPAGSVAAIVRDVTGSLVDGDLILSSYKNSSEVNTLLITEHGECFVGQNVTGEIGSAAAYDPHVDGSLSAALYAVGNSDNRIGSFNTLAQNAADSRDTRVSFAAITLAGTVHEQALWTGLSANAGEDTESYLSGLINNGTALAEAVRLSYFDDWGDPLAAHDEPGIRADSVRSLTGGVTPVRFSHDESTPSGDETLVELVHTSDVSTATMITNGASLRLAWRIRSTDPFDDQIFHISSAPAVGGYEMRFAGFAPGTERLLMNLHADASVADTRVEIYSIGAGAPDPFVTENLSPLQVNHNDSGSKYGGVDIGNRTAGGADGDRSSAINFLGIRSGTLTEGRLGGIRCHYDFDATAGSGPGGVFQAGKMMMFVNDGSATAALAHGIEVYSNGYVRSPNTAAWASVDENAGAPVYLNQSGFQTSVAITNPGTGRYILTLATPMVGATLGDPVFVQPTIDGYGGRGFWATNVTIECRTWNAAGTLTNADFFTQAYAAANLRIAP